MEITKKDIKIAEDVFKDHKAYITNLGEVVIVDFKQKDSIFYAIRYLFHKNFIYISGDLGEATFRLTWDGRPDGNWDDISLGYFFEKLTAFDGDKKAFSLDNALASLTEFLEREEDEETITTIERLMDEAEEEGFSSLDHWTEFINYYLDDIFNTFERRDFMWMLSIGDAVPRKVKMYLLGLREVSKQLEGKL